MDLDGLIKEYGVNGVARIILETFKLFAEKIYFIVVHYNFIEVFFKRFFYQNTDKPIMKDDKFKDKVLLFEYLIGLLDEKHEKHTDSFKHAVESIWRDKWSFFAHSGYVNNLLEKIGDLCHENGLPIITFLITYKDGSLSNACFKEKWKDGKYGFGNAKLKKDYRSDFEEFVFYVKDMMTKKNEYQKSLEKWKKTSKMQ